MTTSPRIIRPTAATDPSPYDVGQFPRPPAWTDNAACAGQDPELFFSDRDLSLNAAAKRVCAICPVQTECLRDALATEEQYGVRGGVNFANHEEVRALRGGFDVA